MKKDQWIVLIVDDFAEDRAVYCRYLSQDTEYTYQIIESESGEEALKLWSETKPDIIILDFLLPDMDGLEFIDLLQQLREIGKSQVIMLTGQGNEAIALQAMKGNVQDYLIKGEITPESFRTTIHQALESIQRQSQSPQEKTVVIVDDDLVFCQVYRTYLQQSQTYKYKIWECETGRQALTLCQEIKPDAILLDYGLPDINGLQLLKELKASLGNFQIPAVMVTGYGHETLVVQALKAGAQDYLVKDTLTPHLLRDTVKEVIRQTSLQNQLVESKERQRLITAISLRIRQSLDLQTIINTTTEEVRSFLHCDRVIVVRAESEMQAKIVAESVGQNWQSLLGWKLTDACCSEEIKAQLFQSQQTVINNISQVELNSCYFKLLEQFQIKAELVVPILVKLDGELVLETREDFHRDAVKIFSKSPKSSLSSQVSKISPEIWGLLIAHQCSGKRQWQNNEEEFLEQLAVQLAVGIKQAVLFNQIQNQSLQLQQLKEAAEAANHSKSQFLANMSHELRTPLNAILGFTQLINRDASLSSEQQRQLGIILSSGEHLLALINSVLEMSKIEAGIIDLNESNFDLYELLDNLQEMFQLQASTKYLQLNFERTSQVPQYIQTDQGKLRQILINLLVNALKFTKEGLITLQVSAGTEQDSLEKYGNPVNLLFSVSDTGIGIEAKELDKLGEAFVRITTSQKYQEGSGLGLSISKKYVELMGGELKVNSIIGQGTVVDFNIYASLANTRDVNISSSRKKVIGLAPNQSSYRILVVDDNWENRYLIIKLLKPLGFEVKEASNGQEAVDLWQSYSPHLILMDMRMPVRDGYEATKQIKSSLQGQSTVIIALTASAFEEKRITIISAGCDDFIAKPFQETVLLEKIAQHLGIRYIYEEKNPNVPEQSLDLATILNPSALQGMPSHWLSQLSQATLECDIEETFTLIEQIPESRRDVKLALVNLTKNFQFEKITNLIKTITDE
ncbi:MAG: response regulator [Coleofasciculaceae cyanobacterium]